MGIVVALIAAGSFGAYVVFNYPQQTVKVVEPLTVYSNRILVVQGLPIGYGAVWQASFSNNENTTLGVNIGLYRSGVPTLFNNTSLQPGQVKNVSECFFTPSLKAPFVARIFASSASGVITPEYPVTIVNATAVDFSNQFSVSTHVGTLVYNSTFKTNLGRWTISVSNNGPQPIEYLYAGLQNASSRLVDFAGMRCAGSTLLAEFGPSYASYAQPLQPGQTAGLMRYEQASSSAAFTAGEPFSVRVMAVYADGSEVVDTVAVQAGA